MKLSEKKARLIQSLSGIPNGQDRLAWMVKHGREAGGLEASLKTGANQVEGCLAKLWLVKEFRDGKCYFEADSDAAIVKAVAVLLCEFYSGQEPCEILQNDPAFLGQLGITQHLTPNRRNSLAKIWEMIRGFAQAHNTQ